LADQARKPRVPSVQEQILREKLQKQGAEFRAQATEWRQRTEAAESRVERQRQLLGFSSLSTQLLKAIFEELRQSWHIRTSDEQPGLRPVPPIDWQGTPSRPGTSVSARGVRLPPGASQNRTSSAASSAPDVLDAIVRHFCAFLPRLGNMSELVVALQQELAEPLTKKASTYSLAECSTQLASKQELLSQYDGESTSRFAGSDHVLGSDTSRFAGSDYFPGGETSRFAGSDCFPGGDTSRHAGSDYVSVGEGYSEQFAEFPDPSAVSGAGFEAY